MTRLDRARKQSTHAEQRAVELPVDEQRFACALQCPDGVELLPLGRAAKADA